MPLSNLSIFPIVFTLHSSFYLVPIYFYNPVWFFITISINEVILSILIHFEYIYIIIIYDFIITDKNKIKIIKCFDYFISGNVFVKYLIYDI